MTAGGLVPRAAEMEEHNMNVAARAVGVYNESESRFCRTCSCGMKLERGMEKLTAQAQWIMCVVSS